VSRNLKIKYRQSFGGMLWTLLIPLCTTAVYYFVFKFYMKIQVEHYLGLIISGIIPWIFFSGSLSAGTETLVLNASILSKVPVKPNVFPMTENLTQFINSFLGLPVVFGAILLDGVSPSPVWLLYPVFLLPLLLISYSITYLLSLAYVFFRDLRHFLNVALQMLFYLTPVIYPHNMVPERYRIFLALNPIASFFVISQDILINGRLPAMSSVLQLLIWTGLLVTITAVVVLKYQGEVIENL
jgi:ABC-type polysaccharide/polyol phosphate export permease